MTAFFPMEPGRGLRILLDRERQPGPTDGTVTLVSIPVPRWRGIANLCIWFRAAAMCHVLDQGPDLEHLQRWDPDCHSSSDSSSLPPSACSGLPKSQQTVRV